MKYLYNAGKYDDMQSAQKIIYLKEYIKQDEETIKWTKSNIEKLNKVENKLNQIKNIRNWNGMINFKNYEYILKDLKKANEIEYKGAFDSIKESKEEIKKLEK